MEEAGHGRLSLPESALEESSGRRECLSQSKIKGGVKREWLISGLWPRKEKRVSPAPERAKWKSIKEPGGNEALPDAALPHLHKTEENFFI
jgi:ribonuclease I